MCWPLAVCTATGEPGAPGRWGGGEQPALLSLRFAEPGEPPREVPKTCFGRVLSSGVRPPHPRFSLPLQFNDVLLYTSRGLTASNQFKVHGQLPLYGMTVSMRRGHEIGAPPRGRPALRRPNNGTGRREEGTSGSPGGVGTWCVLHADVWVHSF